MATLNTLRTRGGIIVSIVIGVSLVAFLMGDMLSSGGTLMNARKMRVGRIDGNNVGYVDYVNMVEANTRIMNAMSGRESNSVDEQDQVRDMTWQMLVTQYAVTPGMVEMGLVPGDEEQIDMTNGVYLSPVITGMFRNPDTGFFDPEILKRFVANIATDQSGQALMLWDYAKQQMLEQRSMEKFITLLTKGMYATDLEVADGVRKFNEKYDVSYVSLPYTEIADSTVKASESEIREYYNRTKNHYKRIPSRDIDYVVFNLIPSDSDYVAAKARVDELAAEFRESATPMQYANLNSQEAPDSRFLKESQLEAPIAAALFGKPGAMYGPELTADKYTMARLAEMRSMPDSVGVRHIVLPLTDKERADSIMRALKGGADFAALAARYSLDGNTGRRGGDMGVFDPQQLMAQLPQLANACIAGAKGDIFKVETQYGIHVAQLTLKTAMIPKAQIARVTYSVEPSDATQSVIYGEASKFYTAAAGSAVKFDKALSEQGLSKRNATVRNTERNVSGLSNSRELVRWAFNSNPGMVSGILEIDNSYVVALLGGKNDEEYAPLEEVRAQIASTLVRQKKGDILAGRMKGATLAEVGQAIAAEVKQSLGVQFNSYSLDGIGGVEMQLIGAIGRLGGTGKTGALSVAVKGESGVYMFQIDAINTEEASNEAGERIRIEAMAQGYITERAGQALMESAGVTDNRVKFF
ncbi:MAG: SurA N-terminal domain-containing protein [Rikenellaceae bacterium]|jgi:peptidyl-prolyl cis-trans isomerase D|nr:SurA N-terminal domain-containing protein [Rikenellaceae bacterium]